MIPFGLTNAPAVAMRIGNRLCHYFIAEFVIDDILRYSRFVEEHIRHLDKLFDRMHGHDIYVHIGKLTFFLDTVTYLSIQLDAHIIQELAIHDCVAGPRRQLSNHMLSSCYCAHL